MNAIPRHQHARPDVTAENAAALLFTFNGNAQAIVWRGQSSGVIPSDGKRLRDIRPGDTVTAFGVDRLVENVELYR